MNQTSMSPSCSSVARIAPARLRSALLLTLLAAVMAAAPAQAQDTLPRLEIGTRVKLEPWTHASDPVTGIVVRSTPDTIGLSLRSGYRFVPRSQVFRVRVSDGRSRSSGAKKGAQWGALAMLGLGITVTAAVSSSPEDQSSHELAPLEVVSGVVALGAAGALVGALVGSLVRAEHWRTAWTARQQ
jgi:hypothetical protein